MIYFVQCSGSNRIKIGHTTCPIGRLQTIMGCNAFPVEMLTVIEGSRRLERAYHDALLEWRVHGEWFAPSAVVLKHVNDAKNGIVLDEAEKETAMKGWAEKKSRMHQERIAIRADLVAVNGVQVPELYQEEV